MPLHDWTDDRGWDSVSPLWLNALLFWAQDRLPPGYRAYLGSVPGLSISNEPGRPDLGVRTWHAGGEAADAQPAEHSSTVIDTLTVAPQPDFRTVALVRPGTGAALHIFRQAQLVAAIELVSPRNKDRPSSREFYRNRYLSYLWSGVHLMLVDVHRRPVGFSFVEAMAAEVECQFPVALPPMPSVGTSAGPRPMAANFLMAGNAH